MRIAGVIVAGGNATRMGGTEKLLLPLGGATILESILGRVTSQVDRLAINVRDTGRAQYESRVSRHVALLSDPFAGRCGPLGGIVAGLHWLASLGEDFRWLATFPGDTPFLPRSLVAQLRSMSLQGTSRPVVATDGERIQCLCALWPAASLHALSEGVQEGRLRSVRTALDEFAAIRCPVRSANAFMNVNTWRDLADAERLFAEQQKICLVN